MRYLTLITCAALLVGGCATLENASNNLSCKLSRDCQTQDERFGKLQAVLDHEIQQARAAQEQAVSAMQGLPSGQRAVAGNVRLADVEISDGQSEQKRKMQALESVSVTLPLAAKSRPEYTRAMEALKNLANELADSRGSSSIVVDQAEADVRARRVNTATGTTQTASGKPVAVRKNVDRTLAAGSERYTIQPGPISGQLQP
ncbi:MAG: hypothetical protein FWF20_08230 [Betaproteobacteria bacterium]|nr:hypothetical protein [Betaproteobacteria bacterium]MCL2886752.1 hypothetical protein [Betaproteobacteria bacterium]